MRRRGLGGNLKGVGKCEQDYGMHEKKIETYEN